MPARAGRAAVAVSRRLIEADGACSIILGGLFSILSCERTVPISPDACPPRCAAPSSCYLGEGVDNLVEIVRPPASSGAPDFHLLVDASEVAAIAVSDLPVANEPTCNRADALSGSNHPVNCLTWPEAVEFCEKRGMRLPTEQEWAWIASPTSASAKNPWPSPNDACDYSVLAFEEGLGCGTGTTWPTASKHRDVTADGVFDMAGNVAEWTQTKSGDSVVVCGGSFKSTPEEGGIFARQRLRPDSRLPEVGFRCVSTVDVANERKDCR
jgi:hypothetical protein